MSGDQPVTRVTIVGGGTAGWMTAALLSRLLSKVEIRLVESEAIGTVGVGEATIPHIRNFMAMAGVDEYRMIRETNATFKLGIEFVDWGRPGENYIHGFGKIGRDMLWLHPHHLWCAAQARDPARVRHFDHYSISAAAARLNRFAFPDTRNPSSPIADLGFAYHFDASLFAAFLRRESEARGVTRIEGRIVDVEMDAATGHVAAVRLEGERRVDGDLFVDCSGMRALLIGEALGNGYDDWSRWLLCDRALAVPCESVAPLTPYTRSTARAAGWQWRIPLQHRIGNGIVFSSALMSDEEAAATLLANLDGAPLADPRPIGFKPGRRLKAWDRNVVAVGLSSGFLEPLESTSIHLIQTAIHRLIALFPATGYNAADVAEYNRQSRDEYEDVRDFIIAHYKVTHRAGEPFWDHVRTMDVPDTLAERLALFASSGRFFARSKSELFAEESWVQVLLGQGMAMGIDPVSRFVDDAELFGFLDDIAETVDEVARGLPDHADFIARLPAETPRGAAPMAPRPSVSMAMNLRP